MQSALSCMHPASSVSKACFVCMLRALILIGRWCGGEKARSVESHVAVWLARLRRCVQAVDSNAKQVVKLRSRMKLRERRMCYSGEHVARGAGASRLPPRGPERPLDDALHVILKNFKWVITLKASF
eukprot:6197960-Pleurochrysis_carterae.AAC.2